MIGDGWSASGHCILCLVIKFSKEKNTESEKKNNQVLAHRERKEWARPLQSKGCFSISFLFKDNI